MSSTFHEIRKGAYYDSVVLMRLQKSLLEISGVVDAGVVMATSANLELLSQSDLLPAEAEEASPEDLLIVVRARSRAEAEAALEQVDALMARRRSTASRTFRPKSIQAAVRSLPEANVVLVSVPGRYAAGVARQALDLDRHVFLYSDNVSLRDEISLKKTAREKGLLVMGPDCGTAIVNGIGLGFANRVRRGSIGLVGAAGTGLQAVTSKIHQLGAGISHAIGTGGRDLKGEVGGITALQGLRLLQSDPESEVIILVSKPPDPGVAARLLRVADRGDKPVVICFMGYPAPAREKGKLHFASTFTEAATLGVNLLEVSGEGDGDEERGEAGKEESPKYLRGLFSGGSLADEALRALQLSFAPVYSNIAQDEKFRLEDSFQSKGHTLLDLGEDEFTVGRLHPMLDNDLRLRRLRQEAADPEVGVILMDVVLGVGAHPDPAGELAPEISIVVKRHGVEVVLILIGTEEDPQDLEAQRTAFVEAGAAVFEDTSDAVAFATDLLQTPLSEEGPAVALESIAAPVAAVNVGVEIFFESLVAQGAKAVHVDWRPPAGGDDKLMAILEKMRS
jgi:FdrA protein